jgi:hypothetical protein
MSEIAIHEASHAAVALALGRQVEYSERGLGHVLPGEREGFASILLGEGSSLYGSAFA